MVSIITFHRTEIENRIFLDHDIKPDNILLSSDRKQIKIVDFGISAMFAKPGDDSSSQRLIGSPAFLSPELVSASRGSSGISSDIWAMGQYRDFMIAKLTLC